MRQCTINIFFILQGERLWWTALLRRERGRHSNWAVQIHHRGCRWIFIYHLFYYSKHNHHHNQYHHHYNFRGVRSGLHCHWKVQNVPLFFSTTTTTKSSAKAAATIYIFDYLWCATVFLNNNIIDCKCSSNNWHIYCTINFSQTVPEY